LRNKLFKNLKTLTEVALIRAKLYLSSSDKQVTLLPIAISVSCHQKSKTIIKNIKDQLQRLKMIMLKVALGEVGKQKRHPEIRPSIQFNNKKKKAIFHLEYQEIETSAPILAQAQKSRWQLKRNYSRDFNSTRIPQLLALSQNKEQERATSPETDLQYLQVLKTRISSLTRSCNKNLLKFISKLTVIHLKNKQISTRLIAQALVINLVRQWLHPLPTIIVS
jgi:hypothetical protein